MVQGPLFQLPAVLETRCCLAVRVSYIVSAHLYSERRLAGVLKYVLKINSKYGGIGDYL